MAVAGGAGTTRAYIALAAKRAVRAGWADHGA